MPGEVVGSARIRIQADTTTVERDVDQAGRRIGSSLGRMTAVVAGAAAAVAPLTIQVGALSGALVSAASASLTVVPLITALGQGVGAVAIGFQGFGDAITEGGAALEQLSPNAREAAETIRGLAGEWDVLTEAVQQPLFEGVAGDIDQLAGTLLPVLQRELAASATLINDFFGEFTAAATSAESVQDLNTILASQNTILGNLLDSVIPVTDGLFDLFVPLLPFAERLSESFAEGAENFADWVEAGRDSGEITEFFERAYVNAGNLLSAIRDLSVGTTEFFSVGSVQGASMLSTLADLSAEWRAFAESTEGQNTFIEIFQFGAEYAEQFGESLGNILDVLGAVVLAVAPLVPIILEVSSAITGPLLAGVEFLVDAFGALPDVIGAAFLGLIAIQRLTLTNTFQSAATAVRGFGDQMRVQTALSAASGESINRVGAAAATAQTRFSALSVATRGIVGALTGLLIVDQIGNLFAESDQDIQRFVESIQTIGGPEIEGQISALEEELRGLEEAAGEGLQLSFAGTTLNLNDWSGSALEAQNRADAVREQLEQLRHQQELAAVTDVQAIDAIEGVTTAEARRAGALGVTADEYRAAQQATTEAIEGMADSLSEFIDPVSAFEAANQRAAQSAADASEDASDSWSDFADSVTVSAADVVAELQAQVQAQQDFATNIALIIARGGANVAQALLDQGPSAAAAAAALAQGAVDEIAAADEAALRASQDFTTAIAGELARFAEVAPTIVEHAGQDVADEIAAGIANGTTTVDDAMRDLGLFVEENVPGDIDINVGMDPSEFYTTAETVTESINILNGSAPSVTVDLSPTPFNDALEGVNADILTLDAQEPTPVVDLSPTPFDETLTVVDGRIAALDAERPTPDADMNLDEFLAAQERANGFLTNLDGRRAIPKAGLDYSQLRLAVSGAQKSVNSLTGKTVDVGANVIGKRAVDLLKGSIDSLRDRTVTVTVKQVGGPLPRAAEGMIVTYPQEVLVGEGYQPEVIIPLTDRARARELAEQSGLLDLLAGTTANQGTVAGTREAAGPRTRIEQTFVLPPAADPELVAAAVFDRIAADIAE